MILKVKEILISNGYNPQFDLEGLKKEDLLNHSENINSKFSK